MNTAFREGYRAGYMFKQAADNMPRMPALPPPSRHTVPVNRSQMMASSMPPSDAVSEGVSALNSGITSLGRIPRLAQSGMEWLSALGTGEGGREMQTGIEAAKQQIQAGRSGRTAISDAMRRTPFVRKVRGEEDLRDVARSRGMQEDQLPPRNWQQDPIIVPSEALAKSRDNSNALLQEILRRKPGQQTRMPTVYDEPVKKGAL